MLTAGSLTERVDIMVPIVTRGDMGEQVVEFTKKATVWAAVHFQRGANVLTMGESWLSRTVSVTMRNNSIIHDRCRLSWDDKTYAIDSLNRSRRDGSITIVASVLDENE